MKNDGHFKSCLLPNPLLPKCILTVRNQKKKIVSPHFEYKGNMNQMYQKREINKGKTQPCLGNKNKWAFKYTVA